MNRTPFALAVLLTAGCHSTLHDTRWSPPVDPLAARLAHTSGDDSAAQASSGGPSSSAAGDGRASASGDDSPTGADSTNPPDDEGRATSLVAFGSLGDATLRELIDEAVAQQRDILSGLATVRRSRALAMSARASRMPTVNLVGAANAGRSISPGIGTVTSQSVSITLPISYEVDLFGRYANEHRAADLRAEATEEDVAALTLSVASEVTDAYFDLVMLGVRRRTLEAQRDLQARVLAFVEARVAQGVAPEMDALSQRQLLATTQASLEMLGAEAAVQSTRLAVLLGRSPRGATFEVAESMPELGTVDDAGYSADLLSQRPDVRAALLRLEAADHAVTAAVRAQLPTLRVGVTPGYQALHSELRGMSRSGSGFTWQVNGTLTVPLFDGLRGHATVLDRRAEVEEQLRRYEQLLFEAGAEAESAMALDRQAHVQAEQLAIVRDYARRSREAIEASYRQGLLDYVRVLLAMRDELNAEAAYVDAQRTIVDARVQLLRALGGGLGAAP